MNTELDKLLDGRIKVMILL